MSVISGPGPGQRHPFEIRRVAYYFSPDHKGEHPRKHLKKSKGILQADAYRGFREMYKLGLDGTAQFREAACWAHLRQIGRAHV